MVVCGYDIRVYFLLFMIYSVLGWIMEVTCKLIQYKRFINRGFLIGPYCPIYGCGGILITVLLNRYMSDPFVLFVMAILLCGTLEYLTSYFMEKAFKARWWDYSQRKFNINGRICLGTIIPFGILGLFISYVSNPFLLGKIQEIPELWLNILFWSLLAVFVVDNIVSGIVVRFLKKTEVSVSKKEDNTEEITKQVREILDQKSALHRRLMNAYPKLQAVKIKFKEEKEKIKKQAKEQKDEITAKVEGTAKEVSKRVSSAGKIVTDKVKGVGNAGKMVTDKVKGVTKIEKKKKEEKKHIDENSDEEIENKKSSEQKNNDEK